MKKTLAFLFAAIFALGLASVALADNFQAGETVTLTASSSSSSVQMTNTYSSGYPDVMIENAGSQTAFVGCGGSGITAQLPGTNTVNATPILPGAIMIIRKGSAVYCAGITASSTTTLYFTAGIGN